MSRTGLQLLVENKVIERKLQFHDIDIPIDVHVKHVDERNAGLKELLKTQGLNIPELHEDVIALIDILHEVFTEINDDVHKLKKTSSKLKTYS
jgi:hypothetical protein